MCGIPELKNNLETRISSRIFIGDYVTINIIRKSVFSAIVISL